MSTLKERIEAAKERERKAIEARKALERKAAEGPKRQARRDVTEVREIMLAEEQLRGRYHVGYSGLAEIVRRAKKEGVKPVVATGQKAEPLSQETADALDRMVVSPAGAGLEPELGEEQVFGPAPEPITGAIAEQIAAQDEPDFDPRDEPPLGDEPVALPDPEPAASDMPW